MKVYTRTGDSGETSLFGGGRVPKTHPRVEAYGTVDELNACLGRVAASSSDADLCALLAAIQNRLFDLGADLATPPGGRAGDWVHRTEAVWVETLEADIDRMDAELAPLTTFILPGGTTTASELHVARTVCRRAERRIVEAIESGETIAPIAGVYINRLGDWLFVAARWVNHRAGVPDVPWRGAADP
jgi:cob(I)alamin adenosyltransferase